MSIADLSALEINCHINQVDVARLQVGQEFAFTVDSLGDTRMGGRISSIAPVATITNGVKGFRVELKIENPDPRLRPGMTADVTIPTGNATAVLTVPVSAVFAGKGSGKVAYVKTTAGSSEERAVKVGLSNIDVAEILSGLEENETVLLTRPAGSGN
jgi:RND family efflux transporter MFP subunit